MIRAAVVSVGLMAGPALAQEPVAPDYFVDTVVATGVAQQLALACPTLSVNPQSVSKDSDALMTRLAAEGVVSAETMPWAEDANTRIEGAVQAFLVSYGLDEPTEEKVCEAGMAEISGQTAIGRYLLEVPA